MTVVPLLTVMTTQCELQNVFLVSMVMNLLSFPPRDFGNLTTVIKRSQHAGMWSTASESCRHLIPDFSYSIESVCVTDDGPFPKRAASYQR